MAVKSAKQAPAEETEAKPKSKKLLFIVIGVLVLILAGAAGWYFTAGKHSADTAKKEEKAYLDQPKFIALEPFTVNLQREEGDQFLQVGISLKIFDPELEDKIKANLPEIRSKLLLLLSSKRASELTPVEGKKKLADEIIDATNGILGIQRAHPKAVAVAVAVAVAAAPAAASSVAASAPAESAAPAATEAEAEPEQPAAASKPNGEDKKGIVDVLFTSFIIQ